MGTLVVAFEIAEDADRVQDKFLEALRPLSGVVYEERPQVALLLGRPEVEKLNESDAARETTRISMTGTRITNEAVPSTWSPEYVIDRFETKPHELGMVMLFWLTPLPGGTYVLAARTERFTPLHQAFDDFLQRVGVRCRVVTPLQREHVAQPIENIEEYLRAKVDAVGPPIATGMGPTTTDSGVMAQPKTDDSVESARGPERRGPTLNTQIRAEVFKKLKDAHREWGYDAVAMHAVNELGESGITGNTVRNAHKAMGWKWERADRIR